MFTRMKVWAYLATMLAAGLITGCTTIQIPVLIPGVPGYGLALDNIQRVLIAILNEEFNG